ncbi:unnamed protein product [Mytilus edulis]|uniref:Uncharacterized protein n=1 Tax=Mytilus edulis TaxID=6550 RepID=A0A8S3S834_MYTED|nr:unnamed protein product [Mytilus edulis]
MNVNLNYIDPGKCLPPLWEESRNIEVAMVQEEEEVYMDLQEYARHEFCPVTVLREYIDFCKVSKLEIVGGFLFRPLAPSCMALSDVPFTSAAANARLKSHLTDLNIWEGETPHSTRSGCALTLTWLGLNSECIKSHVGWKSDKMLKHYTVTNEINEKSVSARSLSKLSDSEISHLTGKYQRYNNFEHFKKELSSTDHRVRPYAWEYSIDFLPALVNPRLYHDVQYVDFKNILVTQDMRTFDCNKDVLDENLDEDFYFLDPSRFVAGNVHKNKELWGKILDKNQEMKNWIAKKLLSRLRSGAISYLGKLGEVKPPHIVSPITIEPLKPRLCINLMYLNCFMKDTPFNLDTLVDVPRTIKQNAYLTKLDDKSGLIESFNGYIEPRLDNELMRSNIAIKYSVKLFVNLGYFLNIDKSVLIPTQSIVFLGMIIDSVKASFFITKKRKEKFCALRESILKKSTCPITILQKFVGICISLSLAIPGAKLYTSTCNRAISKAIKGPMIIIIDEDLRKELQYWSFIDNWTKPFPWVNERHNVLSLSLSSDASDYKWGAIFNNEGVRHDFSDYWNVETKDLPIMIKEALALKNALICIKTLIMNKRVTAEVDNQAVVYAWNNQYSNQMLRRA